jgi:zinc transporter, ZIP family
MAAALGWGSLAAASLVLGAWLAFARHWPLPQVGLVLSFGAGALISAVSFELTEEAIAIGDAAFAGIGLALGAVTYYVADGVIASRTASGRGMPGRKGSSGAGPALALGAFLDGVPEQLVLGIGLAAGDGVSVALLGAIFVSNLPEAIGSASAMESAGTARSRILRLWIAVAVVCALASVVGYAIADLTSSNLQAAIQAFAAGALLVMLIDSMIPEAVASSGRTAGLLTTLGFALATGLSSLS